MLGTGDTITKKRNYFIEFIVMGACDLLAIILITLGIRIHLNIEEEKERLIETDPEHEEGAPKIVSSEPAYLFLNSIT